AAREGVEVTESGLQFESLEKGEGASPTAEDTVTVHYRGELIDGTEFDSSYQRGEPATFPLGNVIPGWTEALQKMQEGGKARLVIPPDLAYGEQGAGNRIGPNETLVFEVELIEVEGSDTDDADAADAEEDAG
ncbi:MAG: FKBP-type peptidyl-prolyl cis-trans isomerase, partial [Algiphilus sp.]